MSPLMSQRTLQKYFSSIPSVFIMSLFQILLQLICCYLVFHVAVPLTGLLILEFSDGLCVGTKAKPRTVQGFSSVPLILKTQSGDPDQPGSFLDSFLLERRTPDPLSAKHKLLRPCPGNQQREGLKSSLSGSRCLVTLSAEDTASDASCGSLVHPGQRGTGLFI